MIMVQYLLDADEPVVDPRRRGAADGVRRASPSRSRSRSIRSGASRTSAPTLVARRARERRLRGRAVHAVVHQGADRGGRQDVDAAARRRARRGRRAARRGVPRARGRRRRRRRDPRHADAPPAARSERSRASGSARWCGAPLGPARRRAPGLRRPAASRATSTQADGLRRRARRRRARAARAPWRRAVPGGLWDTPGRVPRAGRVARGGAPARAARGDRGRVEVGRYLGGFPDIYGDGGDATINSSTSADVGEGEPRPADDVAELAGSRRRELPAPDEFAFANSVAILDAWRALDLGALGRGRAGWRA